MQNELTSALLDTIPPAPREPSERARKLIYGYRGGQRVALQIGIIFTLVGLVIGTAILWRVPGEIAIDLHGVKTQGEVLSKTISTDSKGHKTAKIWFRFPVANGNAFISQSITTSGFAPGLETGTPVTVEYDPGNVYWARIEGYNFNQGGLVALLILFFPIVGIFLIVATIRDNRREIGAFASGVPILARVTFRGLDTKTKSNGKNPFDLRWEFDVDGRTYQGKLSTFDPNDFADYNGDQVPVLYLPADPRANTLYVP